MYSNNRRLEGQIYASLSYRRFLRFLISNESCLRDLCIGTTVSLIALMMKKVIRQISPNSSCRFFHSLIEILYMSKINDIKGNYFS